MKFRIFDTSLAALVIAASAKPDAAGNPGVFNGSLSYTVSDPSIVKITPSDDTLSVAVEHVGPLGSATITVTDGIVTDTFEVEVASSETTGILFAAAPVAKAAESSAAVAA